MWNGSICFLIQKHLYIFRFHPFKFTVHYNVWVFLLKGSEFWSKFIAVIDYEIELKRLKE